MNKQDRVELQKAIDMIEEAKTIIDQLAEQEQEKYDNLTEGLQQSERGQKFEENSNTLQEASSSCDEVLSSLEEANQ